MLTPEEREDLVKSYKQLQSPTELTSLIEEAKTILKQQCPQEDWSGEIANDKFVGLIHLTSVE